jgi:hypothetical protein
LRDSQGFFETLLQSVGGASPVPQYDRVAA